MEIPTNIQVPKFIAVVTTNVKYLFRGRRTYYPGLQNGLYVTHPDEMVKY